MQEGLLSLTEELSSLASIGLAEVGLLHVALLQVALLQVALLQIALLQVAQRRYPGNWDSAPMQDLRTRGPSAG